jgi:hypothetical protein
MICRAMPPGVEAPRCPRSAAEEMAADLATDLREAETKTSPPRSSWQQCLDPRSLLPPGRLSEESSPNRCRGNGSPRVPRQTSPCNDHPDRRRAAARNREPKASLATSRTTAPHFPAPPAASVPPGSGGQVISTSASAPVEWILLVLAVAALGFATWLWLNRNRSQPPTAPAQ